MTLSKKSLIVVLRTLLLVQSLAIVASAQVTVPSMESNTVAIDPEASFQSNVIRTWSLVSGKTVDAKLVGFEHSTLEVKRRNGNLYINNIRTPNHLVSEKSTNASLIETLGSVSLPSDRHFDKWIKGQKGQARMFQYDQIVLQTKNGEEHFPVVLLGLQDRLAIQDAWEAWKLESVASTVSQKQPIAQAPIASSSGTYANDQYRSEQNVLLEQQAMYLAIAAGVTDLWEVKLSSGWNDYRGEFPVLVTGRSSEYARNAALDQYPGRYVSTIRKLSARF